MMIILKLSNHYCWYKKQQTIHIVGVFKSKYKSAKIVEEGVYYENKNSRKYQKLA